MSRLGLEPHPQSVSASAKSSRKYRNRAKHRTMSRIRVPGPCAGTGRSVHQPDLMSAVTGPAYSAPSNLLALPVNLLWHR